MLFRIGLQSSRFKLCESEQSPGKPHPRNNKWNYHRELETFRMRQRRRLRQCAASRVVSNRPLGGSREPQPGSLATSAQASPLVLAFISVFLPCYPLATSNHLILQPLTASDNSVQLGSHSVSMCNTRVTHLYLF